MSKGLAGQMRDVRLAVLGLTLMVIVLAVIMLMGKADDAERVERWVEAGGWTDPRGTPIPKPVLEASHGGETITSEESVDFSSGHTTEDVAVASLSSYGSIEATRIAKMAELMLGMGGEYTAKCEAVYNSVTDKVETAYSITWCREEPEIKKANGTMVLVSPEYEKIERVWSGANWGECVGKMMAWRGGE